VRHSGPTWNSRRRPLDYDITAGRPRRGGPSAPDPPRAFPRGLFRRTDGGAEARGQEGAAAGGPRRFGGGAGGFPVGGRLQFAVYHTLYLTDRELVRRGGPTLDLLNGAAASSTGGQPRNEIEAQLGLTLAGFGARLSADWREGTRVQGAPGSPAGDLAFSDLTTLNLRLFENLTQRPAVIKRYPWLRGARLTVEINNLLDERVGVRDALGVTPLGYQSAYLVPAGRTILVSFRKLFF
jgi:iron complex outermembrane receptor protein